MVTHADHDAFAKQAAEAVYPVSDDAEDEEDDKGWGAKEWLSLALASGTLAAGLGAAYLYRKEIGDYLGSRIGGDNRGPVDKFTDKYTGMAPGTLTGLGAGAAALAPVTRKNLPFGDAYRQQSTSGVVDEITKGGAHADTLARNLGNTGVPGMTPEEASKAVQLHVRDAAVNPKNVLAELSSEGDVLKGGGNAKPITSPTAWSWLKDPLQFKAKGEQSNFERNAGVVQDKADEARTLMFNSGHNQKILTPEHTRALEISGRLQQQLGKGYGLDPVTNLPLEHAKAINLRNYAENLGKARSTLPSKGIGNALIHAGIGWGAGTAANGVVNMATGH
jgi:hypothetical protein